MPKSKRPFIPQALSSFADAFERMNDDLARAFHRATDPWHDERVAAERETNVALGQTVRAIRRAASLRPRKKNIEAAARLRTAVRRHTGDPPKSSQAIALAILSDARCGRRFLTRAHKNDPFADLTTQERMKGSAIVRLTSSFVLESAYTAAGSLTASTRSSGGRPSSAARSASP